MISGFFRLKYRECSRILLWILVTFSIFAFWQSDTVAHALSLSLGDAEVSDSLLPSLPDLPHELRFDPVRFRHPETADRPWVKWVWPGTAVSLQTLLPELNWMANQGFGGVEIHLSSKGLPSELVAGQFRDPLWMATLRNLTSEASKRGLEIDWRIGPGIPAEYGRGLHTLAWGETHVRGDRRLSIKIPPPAQPIGHRLASVLARDEVQHEAWLTWQPDSARLIGLWAGRALEDGRSAFYWNLNDRVTLNPDSTFLLDSYVQRDSLLNWEAPPGYWKIVACYDLPLLQEPFHSVARFSEISPDPYSPQDWSRGLAIHPHLHALPRNLPGGRALLTSLQPPAADRLLPQHWLDSLWPGLGFDPTKVAPIMAVPTHDHHWATRMGLANGPAYGLSPQDPLFRATYDHWLVDSCLPQSVPVVSRLLKGIGYHHKLMADDWNQGWYRLAALSSLPGFRADIGGANRLAARLVASGGRHSGKAHRIVAQAFRHQGGAYALNPQKARIEADRLLLAGANELVANSFSSRRRLDTYGSLWQPDASPTLPGSHFGSQFGPEDPLAEAWPTFWQYLARAQYLMRLGKPETDLLVYYPFTTFPFLPDDPVWSLTPQPPDRDLHLRQLSTLSRTLLRTQGDSVALWIAQIAPFLQQLEASGYTWDWIDAQDLALARVDKRQILTPGLRAKGLIVESSGVMPLSVAKKLENFTRFDVRIFLLGQDLPTPLQVFRPDSALLQLTHLLHPFRLPFPVKQPDELLRWIKAEGISPTLGFTQAQPNVRYQSRILPDSTRICWLVNLQETPQQVSFFVPKGYKALRLDPETGLAHRLDPGDNLSVGFTLSEWESQALWLGRDERIWPDSLVATDLQWTRLRLSERLGSSMEPLKRWEWSFRTAGRRPDVVTRPDTALWDWRKDKLLAHRSTEVHYSTHLFLHELDSTALYLLDLGEVWDQVEVKVNTQPLPRRIWRPFRYDLKPHLQEGLNVIEVWVGNLPRNGLVGRAKRAEPAAAFLEGKDHELLPAGLLGPAYVWIR